MASAVLLDRSSDAALSERLLSTTWRPTLPLLKIGFAVTGFGTLVLFYLIAYTVKTGIGVWGNNIPVAWAFGIINFV